MLVAHARPESLRIGRLIPAVANIDALGVIHILHAVIGNVGHDVGVGGPVRRVHPISVGPRTLAGQAGVDIGGRGLKGIGKGVGRAPRRRHVTPQQLRDSTSAVLTRGTAEQARVHSRHGLQLAELHDVGGVDEDHHALVVLAHVLEQRLLLGRELKVPAALVVLKVIARVRALVLVARGVKRLAVLAPQHDERRVRERLGLVQQVLRVQRPVVNVGLEQLEELVNVAKERACVHARALVLELLVHVHEALVVADVVFLERLVD